MPTTLKASANIAQSHLKSIPFGALLGGPLDAAVRAQAYAAKTTADFIQRVGMNEDENGNFSAINVTFLYQDSDGITRVLVVPLLVIIPIPFLEIQNLEVDFKAKITASGSTTTVDTESDSKDRNRNFGGRARGLFGPFGLGLGGGMSATLSSKKDSVATQTSKYSVEYTINVNLQAGQAGVPAGMAAVLSILENALIDRPSEPSLTVFGVADVRLGTSDELTFEVVLLDSLGRPREGVELSVAVDKPDTPPTALTIAAPAKQSTGPKGRASFTLTAPGTAIDNGGEDLAYTVTVSGAIDDDEVTASFPLALKPSA